MKRTAAALLAGLLVAAAGAQAPKVDPQAEVAAVLFAASATQAALAKSLDAKLKARQARIAELAAERKAGDDRHRAEMVAAEESFVAELAARDREYATQIAAFRSTVNDIVATPAGTQALERFNAGDEAGALSILDTLRAGNEKMRAATARLADAAEGRRIARLALEARQRGKVPLDAVIARFEEVVRLDPDEPDDWNTLAVMYYESGKYADARRALDAEARVARDDLDRARVARERADVLMRQGDLVAARRAAEETVHRTRALLVARPADLDLPGQFAESLNVFGEIARRQGDLDAANEAYQEEVAYVRRRVAAPTGTDADRNALAMVLLHLADTLIARGEVRQARDAIEENVALLRGNLVRSPDSLIYARGIMESLMWLTDMFMALGQFDDAGRANTEIIESATRLTKIDPGSARIASDLGLGYTKVAWLARVQGDFATARQNYARAESAFQDLGAPGAGGVDVRQNHALALLGECQNSLLLNEVAAALRACDRSIDGLRKIVALDATDTVTRLYLAQALNDLAAAQIAARNLPAARKAVEEGLALDQALLKRTPANSDARYEVSTASLRQGQVLLAEGRAADARAPLEKALESRRQLAAARPGSSNLMRGIAEVMAVLRSVPGSSVTAAVFTQHLGVLQDQALFWPADQSWLNQ